MLRVCSAAWGLAIAIALLPVWTRPARPGQLPGIATALNIDAAAPVHFIEGLILLPILTAFALAPLIRRFDGQPWARVVAGIAMLFALWFALVDPKPLWVVVPTAIAIVIAFALRHIDLRWTRRDVVLVAALLPVYLALLDIAPQLGVPQLFAIAIALVFVLRLWSAAALPRLFRPAQPWHAFVLSPLAVVFQTQFFHARHNGWTPLLFALGTPLIAGLLFRRDRVAVALLAFVVYPIAVYGYTSATSLIIADGKPRVNFFEDAHGIVPAGEMLHGELPYRDIIPSHGLFEDGLIDYLSMRTRGATVGNALASKLVYSMLNAVALYAVAAAATGSMEAGFLAFLFAALLGAVPFTSRTVAPLFTLAVTAAAVRRRSAGLFALAGFGVVLSILSSLDFGGATAIVVGIAILRFRPRPLRALRDAAIGAACAAVPLFAILGAFGIARSFVNTTLFEVLTLGPVSTQTPYAAPAALQTTFRYFPEAVLGVFDHGATMYVAWAAAAVFTGVAISMRARRRVEPLLLIALWIVVGGMSYAMRHHLHFQFAVAPLLVASAWTLGRVRRAWGIAAFLALLMIGGVTVHLLVDAMVRLAPGPLDPTLVTIGDLPRARGAWFTAADAKVVASAKTYVDTLPPNDTFFDFTNRPMLYFLFDRDCPIRQLGPSWYEPAERQRAVTAQIDRNPHVVAALVPESESDGTGLDGVANQIRAPLVWQYVVTHFEPAYRENGVVFWRRK